jgi:hypothetical protein
LINDVLSLLTRHKHASPKFAVFATKKGGLPLPSNTQKGKIV